MKLEKFTLAVGSFGVNCTILVKNETAWIVDPGQEAERIIAALKERALKPAAILLTHAHFDHIGAVPELQRAFPQLPVYLGSRDHAVITHPFNAYPPYYPAIAQPTNLKPAADLAAVLGEVAVIDTPGHTPGGVAYYLAAEQLLLSGDTLFAGGVGRTDLPGGDVEQLSESLKRLATLPEATMVIPGHGPFTTIGDEKRAGALRAIV